MSYATLSDLQGFLPKYAINDTSNPTSAQATAYLSRTSAIIDGILAGQGYSVPVSGAESIEILRHINLVYAGYWTARIMFPSNTNGLVVELMTEKNELLDLLRNSQLLLPDTPTAPTNVALNQDSLAPDDCFPDWYSTHPFVTRTNPY